METGPLKESRVGDRRCVPDRRRVERRVQGKRRDPKILAPVDFDLNRRQGFSRRIINRRSLVFRRSLGNRRVAASR